MLCNNSSAFLTLQDTTPHIHDISDIEKPKDLYFVCTSRHLLVICMSTDVMSASQLMLGIPPTLQLLETTHDRVGSSCIAGE